MAHLLLHVHADLVKLGTHQAVAGNRGEVVPVHDLGDMVGGDGTPVGNAGGTVLVAAGVTAVGVALGMADEDGNVAVEDVLVHENRVAPLRQAQVHHVLRVLGVVGSNLVGPVELVEQLVGWHHLHSQSVVVAMEVGKPVGLRPELLRCRYYYHHIQCTVGMQVLVGYVVHILWRRIGLTQLRCRLCLCPCHRHKVQMYRTSRYGGHLHRVRGV